MMLLFWCFFVSFFYLIYLCLSFLVQFKSFLGLKELSEHSCIQRSPLVVIKFFFRLYHHLLISLNISQFSSFLVKRNQRKNLLAAHRTIYDESETAVQSVIKNNQSEGSNNH